MEESNDPNPPVSSTDSPLPQKKKKIVLPKKKRSFTRTLKVKKAAERDEEEDVMAETPAASSVLDESIHKAQPDISQEKNSRQKCVA